ncbi:imidazole glycerol phosphate synthase subunit HisH [Brevibacterium daeguense]|uniref:imidazole glycerol phosphate synthase subunit HisH n=1 Tax=Brevibacterium daeguense TaxID=909936 RepID=UPI001F01FA21|nr:imidazole glycerol phosphate synthase subunit HisH [Brevibacterium daeguense]
MSPRVVVLDYGSGNVRSAVRAVERTGAQVELTGDLQRAAAADGLLVPGVGAFAAVMAGLTRAGAVEVIRERHERQLPMLGICVGQQVFFSAGTEHGVTAAGIGLWPGEVTRLEADVIPHMGWDQVQVPAGSRMFSGIENERFYFVHSYAAHVKPAGSVSTLSTHGRPFVAAVEDGSTWSTQFHPEKSGDAGAALLTNWVNALD